MEVHSLGTIHIEVISARDLIKPKFAVRPECYVQITMPDGAVLRTASVESPTQEPHWQEHFEGLVQSRHKQEFTVDVFYSTLLAGTTLVGRATVDFGKLAEERRVSEKFFKLWKPPTMSDGGGLHMIVEFKHGQAPSVATVSSVSPSGVELLRSPSFPSVGSSTNKVVPAPSPSIPPPLEGTEKHPLTRPPSAPLASSYGTF